jgi:hypothetical protein
LVIEVSSSITNDWRTHGLRQCRQARAWPIYADGFETVGLLANAAQRRKNGRAIGQGVKWLPTSHALRRPGIKHHTQAKICAMEGLPWQRSLCGFGKA